VELADASEGLQTDCQLLGSHLLLVVAKAVHEVLNSFALHVMKCICEGTGQKYSSSTLDYVTYVTASNLQRSCFLDEEFDISLFIVSLTC
jgi:hypothetical protein